ncbi:hypothetical protein V5O48_016464 [Marasmius crinis-equi]|uniref:C2H2-type domain-containing protein n=1 Tax=Marasmius crinis-equi TaxID=585013 RepID=A0ABR3ERT1_9AGAR
MSSGHRKGKTGCHRKGRNSGCRKCLYCPREFSVGRSLSTHIRQCPYNPGLFFATGSQDNGGSLLEDLEEEGDLSIPGMVDAGEEMSFDLGIQEEGEEDAIPKLENVTASTVRKNHIISTPLHNALVSESMRPPRRTRKLPQRYLDMDLSQKQNFLSQAIPAPKERSPSPQPPEEALPEQQPESLSESEPSSEPSSQPEQASVMLIVSERDNFGIFKVYQYELPSRDPDEDVTLDDLVDSVGFAVTPRRGRHSHAVFGPQKEQLPAASIQTNSTAAASNIAGSRSPKTNPYAPFESSTTFHLMDWYYNAAENGLSSANFNDLVAIFCRPEFEPSHIASFDTSKEGRRMDAYRGEEQPTSPAEDRDSASLPFSSYLGWHCGEVNIPLPCTGRECSEENAPKFNIKDVWYRKALDVIQNEVRDTSFYSFHLKPFKQFWQPGPDESIQRLYGEAYTSDRMLEMEQDVYARRPADCSYEPMVVAIMAYSDSTQLTHFGDRSLWPGYVSIGNMSKYQRSNPLMFAMDHIVYVPKLPDRFATDFERAATADVLRFVKQELVQLIWALILSDPDFVDAYLYGRLEVCADGITRRLFPRLFAHSAGYVEKILLASIKFISKHLCPQCLTTKQQVHQLGTKWDQRRRMQKREDSDERRERVETARKTIFDSGRALGGHVVSSLMDEASEQVNRNTFSELLHQVGDNLYDLLVADTMHELAGLMEDIFKQCNRLVFSEDRGGLEIINERFRRVPTFDNGVIRHFANNVTKMRKFAFRDFEDVIQCSLPCFEGLLPDVHNQIMLDLLWDFNAIIAYVSLRIHTDSTVASLESTMTEYGVSLRRFVNTTCKAYDTTEIPEEAEKRCLAAVNCENRRRKEGKTAMSATKRKAGDEDGLMPKGININKPKQHMLTHYTYFIKHFGSLDSYTTRMGEREHNPGKVYALLDKERLPPGNPKERYQMSSSERYPLVLVDFVKKHTEDSAVASFDGALHTHLIYRLRNIAENTPLDCKVLDSLQFLRHRIYSHKTFRIHYNTYDLRQKAQTISPRIHYNTYDLRQKAQTISPRIHPDIMLLADEVTAELENHPYQYARVIGIFHANIFIWDRNKSFEDMTVQKKEFLWVRWYELVPGHRHGFRAKRLPKVHFLPSTDPEVFGFIKPVRVIRGVFLEPAFVDGTTANLDADFAASIGVLDADSVARGYGVFYDGEQYVETGDWCGYYINITEPSDLLDRFGDRDLFMRYRGGGVGHSTCLFTRQLVREATAKDSPLPIYDPDSGEFVDDSLQVESNLVPVASLSDEEDMDLEAEAEAEENSEMEEDVPSVLEDGPSSDERTSAADVLEQYDSNDENVNEENLNDEEEVGA